MYKELNGPREELFDMTKKYSPYCHTFILSHPEMVFASKIPVGVGMLIYVGSLKLWDPLTVGLPLDEIDSKLREPQNISPEFIPNSDKPFIILPKPLSFKDAN